MRPAPYSDDQLPDRNHKIIQQLTKTAAMLMKFIDTGWESKLIVIQRLDRTVHPHSGPSSQRPILTSAHPHSSPSSQRSILTAAHPHSSPSSQRSILTAAHPHSGPSSQRPIPTACSTTHTDISDLVMELNLSENQAETLASGWKGCNLRQHDTNTVFPQPPERTETFLCPGR